MMHEWRSQEKLITDWENQVIESPLDYNMFIFDKNEWDNVPSVIPRFAFYMQKYIQGLTEFCKAKN